MNFIKFFSNIATPITVFIIVFYGLYERRKVFDLFIEGVKEGLEITLKIFPTLLGLFFSISLLRSSGFISFITNILKPVANVFNFPSEILPLALLRPISGSAAIGVAVDIMREYGVDSFIGKCVSVIMGSTETTLYTIAVYTAYIKVNKSNKVLVAALIADFVGFVSAVFFCRIMS